jgi:hypothetical protein
MCLDMYVEGLHDDKKCIARLRSMSSYCSKCMKFCFTISTSKEPKNKSHFLSKEQ